MSPLSRRTLIKDGFFAAAAGSLLNFTISNSEAASSSNSTTKTKQLPAVPPATRPAAFTLPPLPYDYAALEPYIDTETMRLHHDKHHAGYVAKLNAAILATPTLAGQTLGNLLSNLDAIPSDVRQIIRNNGGGNSNHSLFWITMGPARGTKPSGALATALNSHFGSFDKFQKQISLAAQNIFGSGWAWLSVDANKKLLVETTPNQDSPLMSGRQPIFGIDMWEHAYYLKHQNRRPEYLDAFWSVVNWDYISERYTKLVAA